MMFIQYLFDLKLNQLARLNLCINYKGYKQQQQHIHLARVVQTEDVVPATTEMYSSFTVSTLNLQDVPENIQWYNIYIDAYFKVKTGHNKSIHYLVVH